MGHTGRAWPELLFGIGLLAFSAGVLWQAFAIPTSPLYARVGPTLFPTLVGAALAALSVLLIVQGLRGGWQPAEEAEVSIDWRALAYVVAGLLANIALLGTLGFTLASTALVLLVARGFGSRQPLRDGLIGFALALTAYFGFAKALGVNIGAGAFENLLGV